MGFDEPVEQPVEQRLGVDTGGTYTDVVRADGSIGKVPSTPDDPGRAVRDAIGSTSPALLAHGTTVATNALLEGRLARVALVTTAGFTDVIEIARQDRPSLYDPWVDRPPVLVARSDRLEVVERLDADGAVLTPYRPGLVPPPPAGCGAVAVCLLHSDLVADHEYEVAEELRAAGWDVSASYEVSPEFREYERTVTTVLNAGLRPVCGPYLDGLVGVAERIVVTTSAGGQVGLAAASLYPVSLLLSGPAAGVRAAAAIAVACGFGDAVTFDMGGTSTDVGLVLDGEPALASGHVVGGYPVRVPALEVHTIGAGGGSVARIDPGGALRVGPESAGADPGPACYGLGGRHPTVTDADLLLGRIPPGTAFPGLGVLDESAARRACEEAGVDPQGIIDVVDAQMEQALRQVSIERGVDPTGLALVAFGGAGPLHACNLAAELSIPTVIVPSTAGVLSAVGLLVSPPRRELVRTWAGLADHEGLDEFIEALADRARVALAEEIDADLVEVETMVDCRYRGQSHEVTVPTVSDFPAEHWRRNGFRRDGTPVEVVTVRAVASAPPPSSISEVLAEVVPFAEVVQGPTVVSREDCTVWVPEGWWGEPGPLGSLVLRPVGGAGAVGATEEAPT
ncbi:MAG: hydantoinase/oxoprolinase family protein [Actinobacteria bacterium]|nr:hydantoinase/oxoprolinase family protein [Actinomycetota bacterium]